MIHNKISKRIILATLLFLVLMSQLMDISAASNIKFSDDKKLIFGHARVLFGYNASLDIEEADVNFIFWVILEDKGEDDVVWEKVRVEYKIKSLDKDKEDDSSISLEEGGKSERTMIIDTAYENLTEDDLHLKIQFSFHEGDVDKDYTFKKNWEEIFGFYIPAFLIIPTICVLLLIGVLRKFRN